MRGLFFKVFIILWIAQSLIFVISTALILRRHFDRPDVFFDAIHTSMRIEAQDAVAAYEAGGCDALRSFGTAKNLTVGIATGEGADLCSAGSNKIPATDISTREITGKQVDEQYIWSVPVTAAASGKEYVYLLSRPHVPEKSNWGHDFWRFSTPQLPVAIVVGGLATFVLVMLVTRPVVRLRTAARGLAQGKLSTRVAAPVSQLRMFEGDEIQALAHDFNYMAERLESLVSAQQLLLRDVSHELRSPLARLAVALELAREDEDPEMAAHLSRIERETQTLNQLIGQLLTLSSMEAMEKVTNFERLSLNKLIEDLIPDAAYEARQRNSSVVLHENAQCVLQGNRQLLHRAVENILRNAIRYTEPGTEVEIVISATVENDKRFAIIEINDRGPGIPDSELEAIFLPFYRVDVARSPDTGGSGVGLAIAVRSVKLHGGELVAFNRPDGGATIRMKLPVVEGMQSQEPNPATGKNLRGVPAT